MKKSSMIFGLLLLTGLSWAIWSCSSKPATTASNNLSLNIVTGPCAVTLYINGSSFANIGVSSTYNGNYTESKPPFNVFLISSSSVTFGNESCQSSYNAIGGSCNGTGWTINAQ